MQEKRDKQCQGGGDVTGADASKDVMEGGAKNPYSKRKRYPFACFLVLIWHNLWCFFCGTSIAKSA